MQKRLNGTSLHFQNLHLEFMISVLLKQNILFFFCSQCNFYMRWSISKQRVYGGAICQLSQCSRSTPAFLRAGKLSHGNTHPDTGGTQDSLPGRQMTTWPRLCQHSPWPQQQDTPWARDLAAPRRSRSTADPFLCKRSYCKRNPLGFGFLPQLLADWWMRQVSLCKALHGLGPRLINFQRKDHGQQSHNEGCTVKLKLTAGRRVLGLSWGAGI